MTLGEVLAAKRGERGLTIEQVSTATRIRAHYLSALESDQLERLASPVYAKGHLTTYARYLGLDPEPLVKMMKTEARDPRRQLGIANFAARPRVVITAPAIAAAPPISLSVWRLSIVPSQETSAGSLDPGHAEREFSASFLIFGSNFRVTTVAVVFVD